MRVVLLFLLCAMPAVWAQKKPVTLEALREIGRLGASPGPANPVAWSPDGTKWLYRQGAGLRIYDAATQQSRALPTPDRVTVTGEGPFEWENRRVREEPVQWSVRDEVLLLSGGDLHLIGVSDGAHRQLTKTEALERDPKLSPDGSRVAFRRGWDLYAMDLRSGRETRLTTGGSDVLRNGGLDWVYPEELDLGTAYWWSPDSRSIAYLQFDITGEPVHPHADLRGVKPVYEPQRFPYAGSNNAVVRLGIVAARGGGTKWLDVGETQRTFLIARVTWSPDAKSLYVVRMTRVQDKLELLEYAVGGGRPRVVVEESDRYWVNLQDEPQIIGDGAQFLWLSERDGYRHIYLYEANGKLVRQLTSGPWEVTAVAGVANGRVYYQSSELGPTERHLYSIDLEGAGKKQLSAGAGSHSMTLGPEGKYWLRTDSSLAAPGNVTLLGGDDREIAVYRAADRRVLDNYDIRPTELLSFEANGTRFDARLIRPAGFDATKKYPAIVLVYGGPQAQGVRNTWMGADLDQVFAHAGFVVWQVDNRGSAGRGHAFETPVYRNLGPIELQDQLAGIDHLVSLGFVDATRIGVRGWSYGGFMTLNAMLNAPGKFAAGIAGAPVTDWRLYDTIYTERYMGLPEENKNYESGALPGKAGKLEGALMLVHNIEDDNVLFQHSVRMIDALARAGKPYELQLYTQKGHAVGGAETQHLNAAMLRFFERHLKN